MQQEAQHAPVLAVPLRLALVPPLAVWLQLSPGVCGCRLGAAGGRGGMCSLSNWRETEQAHTRAVKCVDASIRAAQAAMHSLCHSLIP